MNYKLTALSHNNVRSRSDGRAWSSPIRLLWSDIEGVMDSVSQHWNLEEMELVG